MIRNGKVFVNIEPHGLICLDADSGEVLWERIAHIADFLPQAERAKERLDWETGREAEKSPSARRSTARRAALEAIQDGDTSPRTAARLEEVERLLAEYAPGAVAYRKLKERLGVKNPGWQDNYGHTYAAPVADGPRHQVRHRRRCVLDACR